MLLFFFFLAILLSSNMDTLIVLYRDKDCTFVCVLVLGVILLSVVDI